MSPRRRALNVTEIEALEASITALLEQIKNGDLVASTAFRHRLEGAQAALQAVLLRGDSMLEQFGVENGTGPQVERGRLKNRRRGPEL
jgi:hypothetical protein